ncbi:MAG: hypothetical protein Q4E32_09330 [Bacteroidales bacterium]|nr:hypothetical protein [Bacteroidales bacterium]
MKKLILGLATMMATMSMGAQSSDSEKKNFWDNVYGDLEVSYGTRYKGLEQGNLSVDLGYRIAGRVYPYFRTESSLMLYKHDGMKTYGNTWNIGGGVGVILDKRTYKDSKGEDEIRTWEFTANITSSVGGRRDYRNNSYYAGFRRRYDNVYIGLGYRYLRSRECNVHDYSAFVISLGF